VCSNAIERARETHPQAAEEVSFPIECNWNYMFALEAKMLHLGDLAKPRSAPDFDNQIDPVAVKRAQRRVQLKETGLVDWALLAAYLSLPDEPPE